MARRAANLLSETLHTRVEVGRVQISVLGRLIVDDIKVWDQQGEPMLSATRAGVQISLLGYLRQEAIIVNSAQLFGTDVHLYQSTPHSRPNYQFMWEALASKDTTQKPLPHIEFRSILIRHTDLHYHQRWMPQTPGKFSPQHLDIKGLSLKASLNLLTSDSLNFDLDRLSFQEASGLVVSAAQGKVTRDRYQHWELRQFSLTMPHSRIIAPEVQYQKDYLKARIEGEVTPTDWQAFYPALKGLNASIQLQTEVEVTPQLFKLTHLGIDSHSSNFTLQAKGQAQDWKTPTPTLNIDIPLLHFDAAVGDWVNALFPQTHNAHTTSTQGTGHKLRALFQRLGDTQLTGALHYDRSGWAGKVKAQSKAGKVSAYGHLLKKFLKLDVQTQQLDPHIFLLAARDSIPSLGRISAQFNVEANLQPHQGMIDGSVKGTVHDLQYKGYTYHHITVDASHHNGQLNALLSANDPAVQLEANLRASRNAQNPHLQGYVDIAHLDLHTTHLFHSPKVQQVAARIGVDLAGNTFDNMEGHLSIPHITTTGRDGKYLLNSLQLISQPQGKERHLRFTSPYLTLQADGIFTPQSLVQHLRQMAHNWLPDLIPASTHPTTEAETHLKARLIDTAPLRHFAGIDISLEEGPLELEMNLDSPKEDLHLQLAAPRLRWKEEELRNLQVHLGNTQQKMQTTLSVDRMMKEQPVNLKLQVKTEENLLTTRISWDNHQPVRNKGEIALSGSMEHNTAEGLAVYAKVLPTQLQINDTLWSIKPAELYYRNASLYVDSLCLAMNEGERSLTIQGSASAKEEDVLNVDLKNIDLQYIFTIVHVKPISLGGYVSGHLEGRQLFKSPVAEGEVSIPNFLFNGADMGHATCQLAWGKQPGNLDIQAHIKDTEARAALDVDAQLHLVKDPDQHLELRADLKRSNIAFLNRYTQGILEDLEGRASGQMRIFGKFKEIDLEGDIRIDECALSIPSLNTRYHAQHDSVTIRPGRITFNHLTAYDKMGNPGTQGHQAVVNGYLTHEHFKNMHYRFDIEAENLLGYDHRDFGDMPFYATVFASGKVELQGGPGVLNVNISAQPQRGTTLTYNASNPETLTQANFVTYVDRFRPVAHSTDDKEAAKPLGTASDMYINFDIDLTPEAQLRLLMDPSTNDYISLYGESKLRATYYNKGSFQLYGTYHVDHGTYKMTLQDVIHKDFQFRKGGTIVFGGNPFNADLGLQAVYTVPSVSLNDLTARSTFSNSNVRVNCLMNLGGKAGAPRVTFDFDIPNVNEDEARMVRSLISTEEERNMQVIYLLGIGRFYTYDYTGTQAQSSTAMNSLLSSTLSGQLNQIINNMTGSTNWNFGANLTTGTVGWSDLDVEGMLSGRLLNNRLLLNGSFGYRDNPVAASNFIGDFDIQYLLTRNGNLILKGYSETNDRYFTKSSLTTQGIGLMVKKDFNKLSELFEFLRKKKRKSPLPLKPLTPQ